ncbi:MAG: MFS transporter [Sphingomonadaceae bacterium]|nr:MFS transporter [Sphingomonadaceae bacterium]
MESQPHARAENGLNEWREGAGLVAAAFFGVGVAALELGAIGVLMKPMIATYGWTRSQISVASLLLSVGTLIMAPLLGSVVDRWGARRVVLAAIPLFALSIATLGLAGSNLTLFYVLFAITALIGPAVGPMTWSLGVASRFFRHRGLALGVAMAGISAIGTVTPLVVTVAHERLGLRLLWVGLGGYAFLVAFPLAWLFFYDARDLRARALATGGSPAALAPAAAAEEVGIGFGEALRGSRFWRLAISFIVAAGVCGMFSVHFVAMLTDRGMSARQAAIVLGAMGPGTVAGRILGGLLLDRVFAPLVAAATLVLPLLACLLMLSPGASLTFGVAVALMVGFALGTEGDTLAFLASRYFGLRHYGKIFGMLLGLYGLGYGGGGFLAGALFDATGEYRASFLLFVAALLAAIALLVTLGRYPAFAAPVSKDLPA